MDKIAEAFYEVNPLEGYVVAVDGRKVTIDLGFEQGAAKGQVYVVYREDGVIRHPVTGAVLGVKKEEVAKIKIQQLENNISVGSVTDGDKDDIRPGDRVKKAEDK
jgi:hypothetical protein